VDQETINRLRLKQQPMELCEEQAATVAQSVTVSADPQQRPWEEAEKRTGIHWCAPAESRAPLLEQGSRVLWLPPVFWRRLTRGSRPLYMHYFSAYAPPGWSSPPQVV
jgi:hypothetical protein